VSDQGGWVNSGAESQIIDTRRAGEKASGDFGKNGCSMTIMEAETNKVVNLVEYRADERAEELGFECSVVSAARNVGECRNQFSRRACSSTKSHTGSPFPFAQMRGKSSMLPSAGITVFTSI
jgi:hypothetical protein